MQKGKYNTDMEFKNSSVDNVFLLRRTNSSMSSASVQVDFSPPNQSSVSSSGTLNYFPVFNFDHHYFTPAFVIEADKWKCQQNVDAYLRLHETKCRELSEQKYEMLIAKPSEASSFCCICRVTFSDYLTHVIMDKHLQLLRSSPFCESILDLCTIFNKGEVQDFAGKKKRTNKKKTIVKGEKKKGVGKRSGICSSSTTIQTENLFDQKMKAIQV